MPSSDPTATDTVPYCCFVDCSVAAEFIIHALRSTSTPPWSAMAGPDPYSDDTHACEVHVGALLGWQPGAVDTDQIFWHVRQLKAAE